MHPNPIFHDANRQKNLEFARQRAFGVLAVATGEFPLLSHVPFLLSEDGERVELHLVRSNPIVRALTDPMPARIAVSGADAYISPDWYGLDNQVPTWNYVAVHLSGKLEQRPDSDLRDLLDRQSAFFENQLAPKSPWTVGKMDEGALARMLRMIVPCRMRITDVDGTWKLSQNKPQAARSGAAAGVDGQGDVELACLMRRQGD